MLLLLLLSRLENKSVVLFLDGWLVGWLIGWLVIVCFDG